MVWIYIKWFSRGDILLTNKGILVNTEKFTEWKDRYVNDSIGIIKSIEVTDDDSILAKTDKGVYFSEDAGKSWIE